MGNNGHKRSSSSHLSPLSLSLDLFFYHFLRILISCYIFWLGCELEDRRIGARFPERKEIFLFLSACTSARNPIQYTVQCGPRALSSGEKLMGREADHSPSFSVKVRNVWSHTYTVPYVFMAWCLSKHRGNCSFICTLHLHENFNISSLYRRKVLYSKLIFLYSFENLIFENDITGKKCIGPVEF
jgi:hypothetical protein